MPRPRRRRRIRRRPERMWFKPRGVPLSEIKQIDLNTDELEAMRLKHMRELSQEEAAEKMNVSRSTFARTLNEAHRKVTDFLVKGQALQIKEPEYAYMPRTFECKNCGYEWNAPYGTGRPKECPKCKKHQINLKNL
ncbi:MAG: DUF134 domain-containing protein [archaeon]